MIAYLIDNNVYINLTNKCSNDCTFCVRNTSDRYSEFSLWLKKEPTSEEIISALNPYLDKYDNYVFCGYGEPLYRLNEIITVSDFLKNKGKNIRLNTNGQASLIVGEGVAEKLKNRVDTVSISLNAHNAKAYNELCNCIFGENGFASLLEFANDCKVNGINVVFSIVDNGEVNIEEAKKVADNLNIPLRIRELIK